MDIKDEDIIFHEKSYRTVFRITYLCGIQRKNKAKLSKAKKELCHLDTSVPGFRYTWVGKVDLRLCVCETQSLFLYYY